MANKKCWALDLDTRHIKPVKNKLTTIFNCNIMQYMMSVITTFMNFKLQVVCSPAPIQGPVADIKLKKN